MSTLSRTKVKACMCTTSPMDLAYSVLEKGPHWLCRTIPRQDVSDSRECTLQVAWSHPDVFYHCTKDHSSSSKSVCVYLSNWCLKTLHSLRKPMVSSTYTVPAIICLQMVWLKHLSKCLRELMKAGERDGQPLITWLSRFLLSYR